MTRGVDVSISPFSMSLKILIVRLSAIGDVVHVLPSLHALRRAFPGARIDWLVEELSSPLLEGHPEIDHLYVFQKKWRRRFLSHFFPDIRPFFKTIRHVGYDWAVDFQGLTKSGLAARFSGARKVAGFGDKDGRELNKLFTSVKIRPGSSLHIVERNLALLQALGVHQPEIRFPFPDFQTEKKNLQTMFRELLSGKPIPDYAAVNPGAGWPTKRLPLPTLAELCANLYKDKNLEIVITWGPGEEKLARKLQKIIEEKHGTARIAPPTNLRQLAALISGAGLFIGGDTGPTHIAAAMGVPTLSFFGASDARRNRPYGSHCITIQNEDIPCVPCWKTSCPLQGKLYLQCLTSITPGRLERAAEKLLQGTGR